MHNNLLQFSIILIPYFDIQRRFRSFAWFFVWATRLLQINFKKKLHEIARSNQSSTE
jgi:hypothetical protein